MTGSKKSKTPSKYDSIIVAEYERYKEDCGLKIGDHKILCKVFDAQDKNLKQMLSDGYDVQARVITDIVREMNVLQRAEIADMLKVFKREIFEEIGKIKKAVEDLGGEVKSQKKEIENVDCKVEGLKIDVEIIKKELHIVKKKNTYAAIGLRGAGWTALGLMVAKILDKLNFFN